MFVWKVGCRLKNKVSNKGTSKRSDEGLLSLVLVANIVAHNFEEGAANLGPWIQSCPKDVIHLGYKNLRYQWLYILEDFQIVEISSFKFNTVMDRRMAAYKNWDHVL